MLDLEDTYRAFSEKTEKNQAKRANSKAFKALNAGFDYYFVIKEFTYKYKNSQRKTHTNILY